MPALGMRGMLADQDKWARERTQPELNLEGSVADRNIMLRSKIKQPAPDSPYSNALFWTVPDPGQSNNQVA